MQRWTLIFLVVVVALATCSETALAADTDPFVRELRIPPEIFALIVAIAVWVISYYLLVRWFPE